MKYDIIVADPPWEIKKIKRDVRPNQVEMDYKMMSVEEISNLPIESIANDNSILFMWTIDKYLYQTPEIIKAWGFNYHLTMAWNKTNGISLYGFNRRTEFVVVGLRGKHEAYPQRKTIPTSFRAKSERHSEKPAGFYAMLDVLDGNRIDLFARKRHGDMFSKRWDVWGNEIESDINLEKINE